MKLRYSGLVGFLCLLGLIAVVVAHDSARLEKEKEARYERYREQDRQRLADERKKRWEGLQRSDYQVALSLTPGQTWQSTLFEVSYQGPKGYEAVTTVSNGNRPGYNIKVVDSPPLLLKIDGRPGWRFTIEEPEAIAPGRWRFRGEELKPRYQTPMYQSREPGPDPELTVPNPSTWTAWLTIRDPRDLPLVSRGPNTLSVYSAPVVLKLDQ